MSTLEMFSLILYIKHYSESLKEFTSQGWFDYIKYDFGGGLLKSCVL